MVSPPSCSIMTLKNRIYYTHEILGRFYFRLRQHYSFRSSWCYLIFLKLSLLQAEHNLLLKLYIPIEVFLRTLFIFYNNICINRIQNKVLKTNTNLIS